MKKILLSITIIICLAAMERWFSANITGSENAQPLIKGYEIVHAGSQNLIGILILFSVVISVAMVFTYKKKSKTKKKLADFKYNVSLLRSEKLGSYNDIKLQVQRKKLLNRIPSENENLKMLFTKKAKKLGIGTGELILAAKIQSSSKKFK
ncbi:MAG: hypothetical protein HXY50_05280 [Ignavibacteriaceae bacterium]|nr:hypothetical protein [Ignavibacteriaceae bacterium]